MHSWIDWISDGVKKIFLLGIRLYQVSLKGWMGGCCKFEPSCSEYALQAIQKHGTFRGGVLAIRRIARCHPRSPGGIDPVP